MQEGIQSMKKLKILAVALGTLAVAGSALAIPTLTISPARVGALAGCFA
jgi:hypothetical protein